MQQQQPASKQLGLEEATQRYWKASLAWKNMGDWAIGWTQESFIKELQHICLSPQKVGDMADSLLDDMVHNIERVHNTESAQIHSLGRVVKDKQHA